MLRSKKESPDSRSNKDTPSISRASPAPQRAHNDPVATPVARPVSSSAKSTYIGNNSQFVGDLSGSADLVIAGKFKGKVSLPKNNVTIEQTGIVEATIQAQMIEVKGKIEGQFNADHTFKVTSSGLVKGDVKSRNIVLESDCDFNGSIQMIKDETPPDSAQKAPQPPKSVAPQPAPQKPQSSAT